MACLVDWDIQQRHVQFDHKVSVMLLVSNRVVHYLVGRHSIFHVGLSYFLHWPFEKLRICCNFNCNCDGSNSIELKEKFYNMLGIWIFRLKTFFNLLFFYFHGHEFRVWNFQRAKLILKLVLIEVTVIYVRNRSVWLIKSEIGFSVFEKMNSSWNFIANFTSCL